MNKQYIIAMLALVCLAAGCSKDVDTNINDAVGYLKFTNSYLWVDEEVESVDSSSSAKSAAATRSSSSTNDYFIEIVSQKADSMSYSGKYSDVLADTDGVDLYPGTYNVIAKSHSSCAGAAWDTPYYEGTLSDVLITAKQTTEVEEEITCTLSNIKASVSINPSMLLLFSDTQINDNGDTVPLTINVAVGENSMDFSREESRAAYLQAPEESNTMTISVSGMFNMGSDDAPEYIEISGWEEVVTDVRAGEWRQILLKVNSAYDGNVEFEVVVDTWVYNEQIDVDVMNSTYSYYAFNEEVIIDPDDTESHPNSPVLSYGNGGDIESSYLISDSMVDVDLGYVSELMKVDVTPTAGSTVASITAAFTSTNASFINAITAAGFDASSVDMLSSDIASFLSVKTDATTGVVSFTTTTSTMLSLYGYAGTHTVVVIVIDSEGRRSFTTLTIVVAGDVEPLTVEWLGGYDFDEKYLVDSTLKVVIQINSQTGLTDVSVDIDSAILTEAELKKFNLSQSMSLVNPESEDMKEALESLDFPTGDNVEGLTELTLDITSFMSLLELVGSGTTNFKLTVEDASGSLERTLQLYVE